MRLMVVTRLQRCCGLLTLALWASGCTPASPEPSPEPGDQIIVRVQDSDIPYPTAQVRGTLTLRGGCLMLDKGVVVWPAETSWDPDQRTVVFRGDFEDAAPVRLEETFVGGGGVFDVADDLGGLLGDSEGEALAHCVQETSATSVVFAYPSTKDVPLAKRRSLAKLQQRIYEELVSMDQAEGSATAVDSRAGVVRVWLARDIPVKTSPRLRSLLLTPDVVLTRTPPGTRNFHPEYGSG